VTTSPCPLNIYRLLLSEGYFQKNTSYVVAASWLTSVARSPPRPTAEVGFGGELFVTRSVQV